MTHTPPPPPEFPPPTPPEPPAPKPNRTNAIIIGAAAAVIAAIVTTGIVVVQSRDDSKPAATTKSSAPKEDAATTAADEPDPEPTYDEIDADSFSIVLRTTRRQCFGSAGCNVTVEPKLTYLGLSSDNIDPDAVYEITYEIEGDESGPVIATAELSDQTSLNYTATSVSTASSDTELSVEITDVLER